MLFLLKSTILSYTWLLLTVEVQFCNFQRGGLKDFTVSVQHSISAVAEVVSRTILYHFKAINWIGTHWRGAQRCSLVEGVNSVINFCL